jgi:hypothetical protein
MFFSKFLAAFVLFSALFVGLNGGIELPQQSQVAESRFIDVCPTLFNAKEVAYLHQQGHHEPLSVIAGCYASQVVVTDDMPQYWRYPADETEFLVVGVTIDGQPRYGVIEFANTENGEPMDDIPQTDVESVVASAPCKTQTVQAAVFTIVDGCGDTNEEDYE